MLQDKLNICHRE